MPCWSVFEYLVQAPKVIQMPSDAFLCAEPGIAQFGLVGQTSLEVPSRVRNNHAFWSTDFQILLVLVLLKTQPNITLFLCLSIR